MPPARAGNAVLVMVAQHPVWPRFRQLFLKLLLIGFHELTYHDRIPVFDDQLEVERKLAPPAFVVVPHELLQIVEMKGLADQDAVTWILVDYLTHFPDVGIYVWVLEAFLWLEPDERPLAKLPVRIFGVIGEIRVLRQPIHHIDAETIHSSIQPEAHDAFHGLPDCRVAPVEVRLFLEKGMKVVLAGLGVPLPCAGLQVAAEQRGSNCWVGHHLRTGRARCTILASRSHAISGSLETTDVCGKCGWARSRE